MVFAAFGVDLASWYSRISYLQKSADAAALAGTVWMPNLTKVRHGRVRDSLREERHRRRRLRAPAASRSTIASGPTSTSLRVTVTDTERHRYFSQVFAGDQRLTRSAEAEYNLPLPLGSPLNYFGGDRRTTDTPPHDDGRDVVVWPTRLRPASSHAPVQRARATSAPPRRRASGAGRSRRRRTTPAGFSGDAPAAC